MSEFAQHVFQGVTPDKYDLLVEKARASGIELSGNSGTASKFGVEISWSYSPEAQELTLQCLKCPFFMKKADLDAKIDTLVRENLA
jgi:hypothetical protein